MDERLIIPEIPEPQDRVPQEPTKDVPSGKGKELDESLIKSSQNPADINKALAQLPHGTSETPNNEK